MMVRLKMAETLKEACTFIEQVCGKQKRNKCEPCLFREHLWRRPVTLNSALAKVCQAVSHSGFSKCAEGSGVGLPGVPSVP
jgi:hypothetical protein